MIEHVLRYTIPAAMALLPPKMANVESTAMLLAIGLQESRFSERRQRGGPARGFWQFELEGVRAVMVHPDVTDHAAVLLGSLRYSPLLTAKDVHPLLEHNDTLAACFARLLLWTLPGELPGSAEPGRAWNVYQDGWRPGAPHRATWAAFYDEAWTRTLHGRPIAEPRSAGFGRPKTPEEIAKRG